MEIKGGTQMQIFLLVPTPSPPASSVPEQGTSS
jgi:hypothetical protein